MTRSRCGTLRFDSKPHRQSGAVFIGQRRCAGWILYEWQKNRLRQVLDLAHPFVVASYANDRRPNVKTLGRLVFSAPTEFIDAQTGILLEIERSMECLRKPSGKDVLRREVFIGRAAECAIVHLASAELRVACLAVDSQIQTSTPVPEPTKWTLMCLASFVRAGTRPSHRLDRRGFLARPRASAKLPTSELRPAARTGAILAVATEAELVFARLIGLRSITASKCKSAPSLAAVEARLGDL
jgi:hypothetical protein